MIGSVRFLVAAVFGVLAGLVPASAQDENPESIIIGLSSDIVEVTTDFSGTNLTIFGAVNNPKPEALATGGYDVVVVLEGPARSVVVREKDRIFGMWINADSFEFSDVPRSYVLASTRNLRDISTEATFRQLSLGIDQRYFEPAEKDQAPTRVKTFTDALRTIKVENGQYHEGVGDVRFLSSSLFKATLFLPANIPLGTHRARAFLFRHGQFLDEDSTGLYVGKDSVEQWIYRSAHDYAFLYGLAAVFAAIAIGYGSQLVFRKD